VASWPLTAVLNNQWSLGQSLMKLFPLHRACALVQVKDTLQQAAGFFITVNSAHNLSLYWHRHLDFLNLGDSVRMRVIPLERKSGVI
jgi:hypothetical protein